MGNCCQPRPPEEAGEAVGTLNFGGSGFCGCSRPWTFFAGGCCKPSAPVGIKWDAAYAATEKLLDEVDTELANDPTCCGSPNYEDAKTTLDPKWVPAINVILQKHGFTSDLYAFWTYNGQSSQPHLWMRVYEYKPASAEGGPPAEVKQFC